MHIIVGLGNPGNRYENTRHNMGFLTIDRLAKKYNVRVDKIKFKSLIGEFYLNGEKIILVKPQTFMNNSGEAVREVMNFYKEDIKNLLVVVDDIDIEFATIKIKKKGSAGTHNGLKSIIYQLQSDEFPRLKIGVGKNNLPDLADFVLSGFAENEKKSIRETIDSAVEAITTYIVKGIDTAMNNFNNKLSK